MAMHAVRGDCEMIWYLTGKTLRLLLASGEFEDDELYEVTAAGIRKVP
jgi:hypothetical protein